jgi:hypothetical protein
VYHFPYLKITYLRGGTFFYKLLTVQITAVNRHMYNYSVGLYSLSKCILFKATTFRSFVLLPSSGGSSTKPYIVEPSGRDEAQVALLLRVGYNKVLFSFHQIG